MSNNTTAMPTHLLDFDFSEGGQFINNPTLEIKFLPKVLKLFATFLEYKLNPKTYTHFDHPIYHALPTIFIDYTNGSRHDSGLQLLCRCARHTIDPKAPNLGEKTKGTIFLYGDGKEIDILLHNYVPASMKNAMYNTSAAFTRDKNNQL